MESSFYVTLFVLIWNFETSFQGGTQLNSKRVDNFESHFMPIIQPPLQRNLTVLMGQTTYLHCSVKYLGDKTVSWIRKRDLHILTSGNQIFTSDRRVSLVRSSHARLIEHVTSWTLKIESVGRKDESSYSCQINTEPPLSLTIFLQIQDPENDEWRIGLSPPLGGAQVDYRLRSSPLIGNVSESRLMGPSFQMIPLGSTIELTCLVSHSQIPPNLTWVHNDLPIRPDGQHIHIQTSDGPYRTISKFRIHNFHWKDEGRYSCGGYGIISQTSTILSTQSRDSRSDDHSHITEVDDGSCTFWGTFWWWGFWWIYFWSHHEV